MFKQACAIGISLIVLGFGPAHLRAQDDADLAKARALEKTMAKVIEQNETSIACILVSRSDAYQEFGQGPNPDKPGALGAFDMQALVKNGRFQKLTLEKQKHWVRMLDFTDANYVPRSFGSGVVIGSDLVLTNYHVVQDATKIFVRLPGNKSAYADIHAADSRSDLAVLKLIGVSGLKAIPMGDADKMQRGQFVLTLANPYAAGFRDGQPSASWGILSNIRRRTAASFKEEERVKPFQFHSTLLQTDARLNLGCSGGALLNLDGKMVGLLTSVAAIQGGETPGGFAVPINHAMRRVIEVLKTGEEVDYGWLGIAFDPPNGKPGIVLKGVGRGSPADVDGKLKIGDVVLAIDGLPLNDGDDVFVAIGMNLAGSKIKLQVRRGKDNKDERVAEVTLAKLHVPGKHIASSIKSRPFKRGLRVDYSSLIAQAPFLQFVTPEGVFVSEVQSNTPADRANLKLGDIITHVNGVRVRTPRAFYEAEAVAVGPIELTLHSDPPIRVQLK